MSERSRLIETAKSELRKYEEQEGLASTGVSDFIAENLIEIADNISEFDDAEKSQLLERLDAQQIADFLEELDDTDQPFFLNLLKDDARLPIIMSEMKDDDIADIVDEVSEEERERLLEALPKERAEKIRELAKYKPDTAGGLMTTEFLAVEKDATVRDVKDKIRAQGDLESINNIFVTAGERLLGVFSVRELILSENAQQVGEFMVQDVLSIDADEDAEECYRMMETYHLSSLPVVDQYHDLLGIVTFDDVLTVGEEEASEDVFKMAGSADLHPTRDSVIGRVQKRIPWLLVSVAGGFGAAFVMDLFGMDEVVSEVTKFLPLILMLGGNIATQSSATMVRGFATGEVVVGRISKVIVGEILVGLMVGSICAIIGCFLVYLTASTNPAAMAAVVLSSVVCLSLLASLLGTAIPTMCLQLNFDPAISAGPFITMLIDMVGAAVYLTFFLVYRVNS
ncbi:MAG: magnesium transporter [Planctomycetota bacterium]|jgi:magnesium transporter